MSARSFSITHLAASSPMPGSPLLKRSLFFIHSEPQPVWNMIASPGLMSLSGMFCFASAALISAAVISWPASIMPPLSATMSIRCARVKSGLSFSTPSFFRP